MASKNKPKESQPKAVKPNTEVNLDEVGKVPLTTFKDSPKVKSLSTGDQGQPVTVFDLGNNGERPVTMDTLQPFLTEKEVEKIGIYKWHKYGPGVYTTVVNFRRFKLTESVFLKLKDRGLVIQDG